MKEKIAVQKEDYVWHIVLTQLQQKTDEQQELKTESEVEKIDFIERYFCSGEFCWRT